MPALPAEALAKLDAAIQLKKNTVDN